MTFFDSESNDRWVVFVELCATWSRKKWVSNLNHDDTLELIDFVAEKTLGYSLSSYSMRKLEIALFKMLTASNKTSRRFMFGECYEMLVDSTTKPMEINYEIV